MQVEGREHLPRPDEPAVYVANHQSFMVRTNLLLGTLWSIPFLVAMYQWFF